ncbi:MAG: hypothetical protein GY722_15165 [bacterium]|nr:hypothetical protein [bacterium]
MQQHPGSPARFVTLTYPNRDDRSFGDADEMKAASEDLRRFIQRMRRSGLEIEYCRAVECTKRGRVHFHLITWGSYIPKCTDKGRRARGLPYGRGSGSPCYCTDTRPCTQRAAWETGFGWAEVRKINSPEGASSYIAKYLSKQSADFRWPKYARRFSYSRNFAGGLTLGGIDAQWRQLMRERAEALGLPIMPDPDHWEGMISRREWQRRPWRFGMPPPLPRWPAHLEAKLPTPY